MLKEGKCDSFLLSSLSHVGRSDLSLPILPLKLVKVLPWRIVTLMEVVGGFKENQCLC